MTDQYTKLREALDAGPTKGPWTHDSGVIPPDGPERYSTISADDDLSIAEVNDLIPEGAANADYISAANPATIRALLAETDLLRKTLDDISAGIPARDAEIVALRAERDTQATEIERLRKLMALDTLEYLIATALAEADGYDAQDQNSGLYAVCWSGGAAPEPLGDVLSLEYLPKAEAVAKTIRATLSQGEPHG